MKYIANPVEVDAVVITKVGTVDADGMLYLECSEIGVFYADKGMTARMTPQVGDYLVTQSDHYQYLNPKEVFERKYRPA